MFWWLSPSFAANLGIDRECLKVVAQHPTSHDALIHSVLHLLNIETTLYNPELDPAANCKSRAALLPGKAA
jgi:lipid A ethanolaminephosphotransferase